MQRLSGTTARIRSTGKGRTSSCIGIWRGRSQVAVEPSCDLSGCLGAADVLSCVRVLSLKPSEVNNNTAPFVLGLSEVHSQGKFWVDRRIFEAHELVVQLLHIVWLCRVARDSHD